MHIIYIYKVYHKQFVSIIFLFLDFSHIEIIESPKIGFHRGKSKDNASHVYTPSDKLLLRMATLGENFKLKLKRNPSLVTTLSTREGNDTSCYYHGYSSSHKNSMAALYVCDGVVSIKKGFFMLQFCCK